MQRLKIEKARAMLNRGETMEAVLAALGNICTAEELTAGLEALRAQKRVHNAYGGQQSPRQLGLDMKPMAVPAEVLEDRDRRLSIVPSDDLTQTICKDPPRELSALAQKAREQQQKTEEQADFNRRLREHRANRGSGLVIFLLPPPPIVHDRFDDIALHAAIRKRYSDKHMPAPPPRHQPQESASCLSG